MFAEVPLFPEQASTMAHRVDALFLFLCVVTGTMAVLVSGLILFFAFRYRRRAEDDRTPRILGNDRLEWFWTIAPLFVFLIMFLWGASIYTSVARPPEDAPEVFVIGKQWMWKIQHPDGQREINELHLPVDRPVKLTLTSEDVIHNFSVPAFRTKIDVIPGRYVQTWFHPTKIGEYHLFCSQYCGTSHSNMVGTVVVMKRDAYREWLDDHAEGSLALQGRQLFLKLQCVTCHSADAEARAPVLEGLFRRTVTLRNGRTVAADDAYLRESILYPEEKVVQGWEPIMPTFKGQVDEEDLIKLLSFIRSLKPGQTPVRNEEASPPIGAPTVPPGGNPKARDAVPTSRPKGKSSQP
ncbi:MAG TPA: cytochrome c oxidase subunit II [Gemmataceae bacterium]|jgi:cytochrome c oxidase subunit 2